MSELERQHYHEFRCEKCRQWFNTEQYPSEPYICHDCEKHQLFADEAGKHPTNHGRKPEHWNQK